VGKKNNTKQAAQDIFNSTAQYIICQYLSTIIIVVNQQVNVKHNSQHFADTDMCTSYLHNVSASNLLVGVGKQPVLSLTCKLQRASKSKLMQM